MTAIMQDESTRDGTDANALPPIVEERRWLYLNVTTWQKILAPVVIGLVVLGLWEFIVWKAEVPYYILPGPWRIFRTLIADWGTLSGSLWITLQITGLALLAAVLLGGLLSILFTQSKWLEFSLFPYAIILQVTPIVAIAPLIIIWVNDTLLSLLICAWIVAFFPILSNTILGLNSADAALPAPAGGAALFPGRPAHLRRPGADRRGGRRVRRRLRRHRLRPGLPHSRSRIPAEDPAHVRGTRDGVGRRHCYLPGAELDFPPVAAALARERHPPGELT